MKILGSIGICFIILCIEIYTWQYTTFDNSWNKYVHNICILLIFILLIIIIWNKKHKKVLIIFTCLTFLTLITNAYYYKNYSMKIEPLLYLHHKYKIPFSDMKIIKCNPYHNSFLSPYTPRETIIKHHEYYIEVTYEYNKWIDNYQEKIKYNDNNKKNIEDLHSILKIYNIQYKILEDLQVNTDKYYNNYDDFGYIIYIYCTDENIIENIITHLDNYTNIPSTKNLLYSLYIVKEIKLYNELVTKDISELNTENTGMSGQTYPQDIFEIMNYENQRISFMRNYDKEAFINNVNINDIEYQNPENFEHIIFYYENSSNFQIFGINKNKVFKSK